MNKKFYLIIAFFLLSAAAFAQDKIFKKNGDVIEAKVIEIGETEIKYKIFTDLEGPTYSVDKDRLRKIIYKGGREETFLNSLKDTALYQDQAKNAIKLNFLAPLLGFTQFNFEHNIKPGRSVEFSLGIIGLGKNQKVAEPLFGPSFTDTYKRNAGGAFIGAGYKFIKLPNFIRSGDKYSHIMQGFYAKPEVLIGFYSQDEYPDFASESPQTRTKESVAFGAFVINIGKQWVLGEAFLIDLYTGLGYAVDNVSGDEGYGGSHFALIAGDNGMGITGGFKVGVLLNKKKTK